MVSVLSTLARGFPFIQRRGEKIEKCGIGPSNENAGSSARIINGEPTTSKRHPWTAQIYRVAFGPKKEVIFERSSGTIISCSVKLTCSLIFGKR